MDKFKDACGVFGIYGHEDAAHMTYLGLYALQHRGQESAGIAVANDGRVRLSRAMGYVSDVFNERVLAGLRGRAAIGHVRYSTSGDSRVVNAQPLLIECAHGQIALCHNGNLVNATELRAELVRRARFFRPIATRRSSSICTPRRPLGRPRMPSSTRSHRCAGPSPSPC